VYLTVNAVESGLVATPAEWPGLRTLPSDVGRVLAAERPAVYFRSEADAESEGEGEGVGEDGARCQRHVRGAPALPARAELELTRPPQFADLTDAQFQALLDEQVTAAVAEIHARRRAAGSTEFLGAWGVLTQDPESVPGGPGAPDFRLGPTVATTNRWRRVELLQQRVEFLAEYRLAWGWNLEFAGSLGGPRFHRPRAHAAFPWDSDHDGHAFARGRGSHDPVVARPFLPGSHASVPQRPHPHVARVVVEAARAPQPIAGRQRHGLHRGRVGHCAA
jgi:hypothetical protein